MAEVKHYQKEKNVFTKMDTEIKDYALQYAANRNMYEI
jgi:hypothetical protein